MTGIASIRLPLLTDTIKYFRVRYQSSSSVPVYSNPCNDLLRLSVLKTDEIERERVHMVIKREPIPFEQTKSMRFKRLKRIGRMISPKI